MYHGKKEELRDSLTLLMSQWLTVSVVDNMLFNLLIIKLVKCHYNFIVSLSTTATKDTHHTGMASGQLPGIHQKWWVILPDPWTTLYAVQCWRPITSSIQNPNQSLNSKKRCRWSGTACHRNWSTSLLKASDYDCRDVQKLAVNNLSTQCDCQTSDKVFTVLFQWRCFTVFRLKCFSTHKNR